MSSWDYRLEPPRLASFYLLLLYFKFWGPSKIDWIKKIWHIHTVEYYAAIKNNEFMPFVGTWMNLETIILSKLTQEQKIKHHMFSLVGGC